MNPTRGTVSIPKTQHRPAINARRSPELIQGVVDLTSQRTIARSGQAQQEAGSRSLEISAAEV